LLDVCCDAGLLAHYRKLPLGPWFYRRRISTRQKTVLRIGALRMSHCRPFDRVDVPCGRKNLSPHGAAESSVCARPISSVTMPPHASQPAIDEQLQAARAEHHAGRIGEAARIYRRVLRQSPHHPDALRLLGIACSQTGRHGQAVGLLRQAIDATGGSAVLWYDLGVAMLARGKPTQAVLCHRQSLKFESSPVTHSALLSAMQYCCEATPEEIFHEHRAYAARHAAGLASGTATHTNPPDPQRRLRVGLVSPDLREHSVAYFLDAIVRHRDRESVEIVCYDCAPSADPVSARLQALSDGWRDISQLTDADAATAIRNDRIDVLIDLAGHTENNRLMVFARKPAPVQTTYLGYPDTTGLATIDYRLTDAVADPPGLTDRFHSESLLRLPRSFLCYTPPRMSPPVAPPPSLTAGRITFGSFNNPAKIGPDTVELWSRVLHAVDGSRLLIKGRGSSEEETRRRLRDCFATHGCGDRVTFLARTPTTAEHLAAYGQVDIALDTIGYNGTTTTCEALWMGVPVVSLVGIRHAQRVGASILRSAGFAELAAETPETFVSVAKGLAKISRLATLRSNLRPRVRESALTDATGFMRGFEGAIRQAWRTWCSRRSSPWRV
jgi:predicted O-linked N-acetylglucosamine transferase (SPINDLY family)